MRQSILHNAALFRAEIAGVIDALILNAVAAVPKADTLNVIVCLEFFHVPLLCGLIVQIILLVLFGHRDGFSHFLVFYLFYHKIREDFFRFFVLTHVHGV